MMAAAETAWNHHIAQGLQTRRWRQCVAGQFQPVCRIFKPFLAPPPSAGASVADFAA